jgi:hypothetical protein
MFSHNWPEVTLTNLRSCGTSRLSVTSGNTTKAELAYHNALMSRARWHSIALITRSPCIIIWQRVAVLTQHVLRLMVQFRSQCQIVSTCESTWKSRLSCVRTRADKHKSCNSFESVWADSSDAKASRSRKRLSLDRQGLIPVVFYLIHGQRCKTAYLLRTGQNHNH